MNNAQATGGSVAYRTVASQRALSADQKAIKFISIFIFNPPFWNYKYLMLRPYQESKAKQNQRRVWTRQTWLFHANLCPGIRCSLCPLIFFNEHSLFIWVLREPARTEVRAEEHKTDTKAGFVPEGFSPRLNFLALYKYSVVPRWLWQCPITLTPLHLRPGLPQTPGSWPAGPRTPLMYVKHQRLPSSSVLSKPYQRFWFFSIYLPQQSKAPQPPLLIIPNHLSIFHTPEDEKWEQSQTQKHIDAAP